MCRLVLAMRKFYHEWPEFPSSISRNNFYFRNRTLMAKYDPLEFKNEADAALERAATRLRAVLKEAVAHLDPFPPFPGAFFSYGIEIDAPGVSLGDVGCVILGQDAELYELKMGEDVPVLEMEITDPV